MKSYILTIGNNKAMNYLLQTVIGSRYKLVASEDVFHGMYQLKNKHNINLIIIDIDHRTKESIDFIHHINSSKLYNKPVIVLSNTQTFKSNEATADIRVSNVFMKPFSPIELIHSVDKIFQAKCLS